jgi:selenocysteine-specific translation elongation factor
MENLLAGVFGADPSEKLSFEEAIGKKNESTSGMTIFHRNESGRRISLLDDDQFPEKIQGYSRIASLTDYSFLVYPSERSLTPADGELALLVDAFRLRGSIVVTGSADPSNIRARFKGLSLADHSILERQAKSSLLDTSDLKPSAASPKSGSLVYIDRAFSVKGVGLVVLGFVLSGKISIHDRLRLVATEPPKFAEVKGIQINDVDQEYADRGVRVGLSLKGVELRELERVAWLDDSSFAVSQKLRFDFEPCNFYKQSIEGRDLHIQCAGELKVCKVSRDPNGGGVYEAAMQSGAPFWDGMRTGIIDLNGKPLRIAGGGRIRAE